MNKSVESHGRALFRDRQYHVEPELADKYIRLGWAILAREATAMIPPERKATERRVIKR